MKPKARKWIVNKFCGVEVPSAGGQGATPEAQILILLGRRWWVASSAGHVLFMVMPGPGTSTRISSHAHDSTWHCEISQSAHKTQYRISSEKKTKTRRGETSAIWNIYFKYCNNCCTKFFKQRTKRESPQIIKALPSQSCFYNLHISK